MGMLTIPSTVIRSTRGISSSNSSRLSTQVKRRHRRSLILTPATPCPPRLLSLPLGTPSRIITRSSRTRTPVMDLLNLPPFHRRHRHRRKR